MPGRGGPAKAGCAAAMCAGVRRGRGCSPAAADEPRQQPTWSSCFRTGRRFRSCSPHRCGDQVRILEGGKVMRPLSVSRTKLPKLGVARSGRGRARPSHRLRSRGNRAAAGRWTSGQAHQMRRRMGPRRRAPRGHHDVEHAASFVKLRRRQHSLANFVDVSTVWAKLRRRQHSLASLRFGGFGCLAACAVPERLRQCHGPRRTRGRQQQQDFRRGRHDRCAKRCRHKWTSTTKLQFVTRFAD